jgi:hypothetical protein
MSPVQWKEVEQQVHDSVTMLMPYGGCRSGGLRYCLDAESAALGGGMQNFVDLDRCMGSPPTRSWIKLSESLPDVRDICPSSPSGAFVE